MDAPPPAPPPPPPPARSPERFAISVAVVVLFGLLLYRGYGNGYRVQPSLQNVAPLPLDVNAADRTELLQIPGVGPTLADAILTHRSTFGPFQSLEELDGVPGIGVKTLDKLRNWLVVDAKTPAKPAEPKFETLVRPAPPSAAPTTSTTTKLAPGQTLDPNTATLAELQQLPGIGPKMAERIVAERTKKPFESVDDLRRVSGIGVKTLDKLRPHLAIARR
jgi:competence protein ComEA